MSPKRAIQQGVQALMADIIRRKRAEWATETPEQRAERHHAFELEARAAMRKESLDP